MQPTTLLIYRRRAAEFYQWCVAEGACPWSPDEWDDTIMDYKSAADISKNYFAPLIAGIEFKFPRMKGKLLAGVTNAFVAILLPDGCVKWKVVEPRHGRVVPLAAAIFWMSFVSIWKLCLLAYDSWRRDRGSHPLSA